MPYFLMHETTTDYWLNPDDGKWYRNKYSYYENNVTYFVEQLAPSNVSTFRYKVIFNPTTIIPDVDLHN